MKCLIQNTVILFLLLLFCTIGFGQKPVKCKIKNIQKPKFKIAFLYTDNILSTSIVIKPKEQTDENLILLAKYIKAKYCKENLISVLVFDKYNEARGYRIIDTPPGTLRAMYYLNRKENKEELVRIKVVDNKFVETPIEMYSGKTKDCESESIK